MKALLFSMLTLASCGQEANAPQAPPAPPRTFKTHLFLRDAVIEGLKEDGADRAFVKQFIVDQSDLFVPKCLICEFVRSGCSDYARGAAETGKGMPKDIVDELQHAARLGRLNALERLVDRYVSRHQERLRMTAEERRILHERLEELKKEGMKMKEVGAPKFGDFCPSCNGAAKAR